MVLHASDVSEALMKCHSSARYFTAIPSIYLEVVSGLREMDVVK